MTALVGGGSSSSRLDVNPNSVPEPFQNLRDPGADTLLNLLNLPGQAGKGRTTIGSDDRLPGGLLGGVPKYEGPLVAPITQAETDILGQIAAQTGPGTARAGYLDQVLGGQYLTPDANPFLKQFAEAANRQTLEQYEHLLDRVLPGQFTRAGQNVNPGQSSAFDTAAAIQARGLAQSLSDTNAKIFGQAYENERMRQQEATQLSQQEVDTTIKSLQAHALPRLIEDLGIERGMAEFQRQVDTLMQTISILMNIPMNPAVGTVGHSSQTNGLLPAIGAVAGGASGFLPPAQPRTA